MYPNLFNKFSLTFTIYARIYTLACICKDNFLEVNLLVQMCICSGYREPIKDQTLSSGGVVTVLSERWKMGFHYRFDFYFCYYD